MDEQLKISNLNFEYYNVYDVFNAQESDIKILCSQIVVDEVTDNFFINKIDIKGTVIAYQSLPGQFDMRANAVKECLQLLVDNDKVEIFSGIALVFDRTLQDEDIIKIKKYLINPIESIEKKLDILDYQPDVEVPKMEVYNDFNNLDEKSLAQFLHAKRLAMNIEDLKFIQQYFKNEEKRIPTETEIKVLDTYWSDHCRHTTFETILTKIDFEEGIITKKIQEVFNKYLQLRTVVHQNKKPITLMDLATIVAKYMRLQGALKQVEISEEINACSIEVQVNVNNKIEPYLLMFKNETHNHPTEIEPYGGASTCLGGAIRDPLSGRSYVFQAMRISGAGDITENIKDTLKNKLPQKVISKKAAHGFSSYGNQIGLATTFVKEIFHEGYKAKRMEVGMVVGAVKESWVRRESLKKGDVVILLGGKTGRDGIGGAVGSSKQQDKNALTLNVAEVQKGNAPIERRLQRFFNNEAVCKLIKKANDFGAGGVCVAVGEIADGVIIDLNKIPTKYKSLTATELTISESQERMAIGVDIADVPTITNYALAEGLETFVIAEVTDQNRLVIKYNNEAVVNISRTFLNTSGVRQQTDVLINNITQAHPFSRIIRTTDFKECVYQILKKDSVASMQGMVEMFDATIGSTTVLMPYGGKYQLTEEEASVQLLPVLNTSTCSVIAYGFDPHLCSYSPFIGASYSVINSLAKLVAVGASYKDAHLSFQEYFQKLKDKNTFGLPVSALLGAMEAQLKFNVAAIGGKDSMNGTYQDLNVPPTLISFAVNTQEADNIISAAFKKENNFIYLVQHLYLDNHLPNYEVLIKNFDAIENLIKNKQIVAVKTIQTGGIIEAICKMSFGNKIGCVIESEQNIFDRQEGSFIIEATQKINLGNFILLGTTNKTEKLNINQHSFDIDELIDIWQSRNKQLYPPILENKINAIPSIQSTFKPIIKIKKPIAKPRVLIPVFLGNNCEYDMQNAFIDLGSETEIFIFNDLSKKHITESLKAFEQKIKTSQILAFPGGFSVGDEPDGSGKYIANVLCNPYINDTIKNFLLQQGLIIGVCNGFQALVKSGLLPWGLEENKDSLQYLTLFKNEINRHVSKLVQTRISSVNSPWLSSFKIGDIHTVPISNGEGKIICSPQLLENLKNNGQIATQYVNFEKEATMQEPFNPNGSFLGIESLISPCGQIFGKMAHSERKGKYLYKNIPHVNHQYIFKNGVDYFR